MQLNGVQIMCSSELEEPLTYFLQSDLAAKGIEVRRRSDFDDVLTANILAQDANEIPDDMELTAYFAIGIEISDIISQIKAKLLELKNYGFKTDNVEFKVIQVCDKMWQNQWEKFYHRVDFSRSLDIVPEWECPKPLNPHQIVIKMNPKQAFGTGTHITTQLMLMVMERVLLSEMSVLDVGTGSGILSIVASKFGASNVCATDISDDAIASAKKNLALNDIDNVELKQANLLTGVKGKYDLILANMLAEILYQLIPHLSDHLARNGSVIMSGIDCEQLSRIEKLLSENGFTVNLKIQEKRWFCILVSQKSN